MLRSINQTNVQIAGIKILRKIGEGGMSIVYLGEQTSLKRNVAVKVLKHDAVSSDLDIQRFKQEAKTIAQLNHPNIISIYDIGQTKTGEVYFTMPYLNHGNLSSYQIENEKEFVRLMQSICDGLSFAHNRGIVHRDIKPDNLIFDAFGQVKIADFGIALSKQNERMTKEHQIVGSAQYMSPEQARSLKVGAHSDIYSLGIVIYERITGKVPFDSEEGISILINHVSTPPARLPAKLRHWQPLIDKCLAKEPENRFQSMVELKQALGEVPLNKLQKTNYEINQAISGRPLKPIISLALVCVFIAGFAWYFIKNNDHPATPVTTEEPNPTQIVKLEVQKKDNPDQGFSALVVSDQPVAIEDVLESDELIDPQNPEDDVVLTEEQKTDINQLLQGAEENIKKYRLLSPKDNNATDQLLVALVIEPENQQALDGLEHIKTTYQNLILSNFQKADYAKTLRHSRSLSSFYEKTQLPQEPLKAFFANLKTELDSRSFNMDKLRSEDLNALVGITKLTGNQQLRAQIDDFKLKSQQLKNAQQSLNDLGIGTVLFDGDFLVSKNEITKEQFQVFYEETQHPISKCKHQAGGLKSLFSSKNWQNPPFEVNSKHPVVCVSAKDAQAYAKWLGGKVGLKVSLPTLAQWQSFAAVAANPFADCQSGNVAGAESQKLKNKDEKYKCDDAYKFTAPVAQFQTNAAGLNDLHGNVSEWIYDCDNLPCEQLAAIGSSWFDGIQSNRLDKKQTLKPNQGYSHVGFRLVVEKP